MFVPGYFDCESGESAHALVCAPEGGTPAGDGELLPRELRIHSLQFRAFPLEGLIRRRQRPLGLLGVGRAGRGGGGVILTCDAGVRACQTKKIFYHFFDNDGNSTPQQGVPSLWFLVYVFLLMLRKCFEKTFLFQFPDAKRGAKSALRSSCKRIAVRQHSHL